MKPIIVKLAGVTYGDTQKNIKKYGGPGVGDGYDLVREPDNPADPNAIQIVFLDFVMGYVPRKEARKLAPLMDKGRTFIAEFVNLNKSPSHSTVGMTLRIVETNNQNVKSAN